jgi:L-arabinokinase
VLPASIDTGVVEHPSTLSIDAAASVDRLAAFVEHHDELLQAEVSWVRSQEISLIVSDIPYLAGDVAAAVGVPCIGISNFLWDWIYEPFLADDDRSSNLLDVMRRGYARMERILRLPFGHQMNWLPRVTDVPLVTAGSTRTSEEVRAALGIGPDDNRPLIFLAMRAQLPAALVARAAAANTEFVFVTSGDRDPEGPENLLTTALGPKLTFADMVAGADTVVSKAGYGTVAACAAFGTNLLYPPRRNFREDEVLLSQAQRYTRIREIPESAYLAGDWTDHLQALRRQNRAGERPPVNGAEQCAAILINGSSESSSHAVG